MERILSERELDHLFAALILHTKTTRKEQIEWVVERRAIWKTLVRASTVDPNSEVIQLRTKCFESPNTLQKDPTLLAKAFHG
jgi:hypothetical protein